MEQIGWAIEIKAKNGSIFFALSHEGTTPAVWIGTKNRKYAVKYKNELKSYGLKGRVVRVKYTQPVIF